MYCRYISNFRIDAYISLSNSGHLTASKIAYTATFRSVHLPRTLSLPEQQVFPDDESFLLHVATWKHEPVD